MGGTSLITTDAGPGSGKDPLVDQTLRGYQLCERLGSGGFGAVYRAYQPAVDREVAIKVIKAELADDRSFILRFEREAQTIARLEHPHIVPLYDYWREPGGAYLVMRLMRGGSLGERVRARPLEVGDALSIFRQVAEALDSAHRRGVVHRDLKPQNVMLDEEGRAYLADFGLASYDWGEESLAERGMLVGSPFYLPPEVIKGDPASPAGDIYSLGVVLFEMLAGIVPFGDSPPGMVVLKHIQESLPDVGRLRHDLPATVNSVIQHATAHRPEQRYATAGEMAAAFAAALEATPGIPVDRPAVFNPYKGLRAFQEGDAADFFGREALTQQLLARLAAVPPRAPRFLAVIGPSGSGKSSLVRAGLVPALRAGALPGSQHWVVADMFPGSSPLAELEQALLPVSARPLPGLITTLRADPEALVEVAEQVLPADPAARLVLIVDQFEETFTLATEQEQRQFLEVLWQAINRPGGRCLVIVTLRADFYDRPLVYAGWGRLFRDQAQVVLPPTSDELRQAIVRPADNAGLRFEEGLPEAILADVRDEPGTLPLLQYALTELVERCQDRLLTRAAYHEAEGVAGALAQRAEALYSMLPLSGQAAVRRVFMRLVTLGEGTEDTRRRVPRREMIPAAANHEQRAELDNVLGLFTRYRLLTADRDPRDRSPTVEVAHESLIRLWHRLREWLDASRDDLRLQRRLTLAAADWHAAARDPSFLATGVRLSQLETLAANPELALNEEELEFVRASVASREAQAAAERERQQRELDTARRLAETEKRRAEEQARTASKLRRGAWALGAMMVVALIAALAAALLARSAGQIARQHQTLAGTAQAASTQALALAQSRATEQAIAQAASTRAVAEAESRATQQIVAQAASTQAVAESRSRATQQALAQDSYARAESQRLAAEANGLLQRGESAELAALVAMHGLQIRYTGQADAALQRAIRFPFGLRVLVHPAPLQKVAYAPDGQTVLTGAADGVVRLWDVKSGRLVRELKGHSETVQVVAYSPDGRYALSGGNDATARVWDLASGVEVARLDGHTDIVNNLGVSAGGRYLATTSDDMTVRVWDLADGGREVHTWEALAGPSAVEFSPDERFLVVGMYTGECEVWDAATGEVLRSFDGHTDTVWSLDFSPDGKTVLTAANDTTARLWDFDTGRPVRTLSGHTEAVFQAVFSPQGDRIFTGSLDLSGRLWDTETGRELRRFTAATSSLYSVAYSPDGRYVLSGSTDNMARLWDLQAPPELDTLAGQTLPVWGLAYSHDGRVLAAGSNDMTVRLWDVATGKPLRVLTHAGSLYSLDISPDDRLLVAGTYTGAYLWDLSTGMTRTVVMPEEAAYWVGLSPDGRTFLAAMSDYAVHVYDSETGAELRTLAPDTSVSGAAVSPDGRLLAIAGDEPVASLWDIETGEKLRTFEHPDAAVCATFSPDGRTLLTGSRDMVGRVWDVESGELVRELVGHTSAIWMVAFSADGEWALTASQDKTARLWDMATGQTLRVFPGHANSAVGSAALAPDGRQVAVGSFDGAVTLAYTDVAALMQAACERVWRELTDQERDAYGISDGGTLCPEQ